MHTLLTVMCTRQENEVVVQLNALFVHNNTRYNGINIHFNSMLGLSLELFTELWFVISISLLLLQPLCLFYNQLHKIILDYLVVKSNIRQYSINRTYYQFDIIYMIMFTEMLCSMFYVILLLTSLINFKFFLMSK